MKKFLSLSVSLLTAATVHLTTLHAASVDVFYTDFESGMPAGFTPAPLTSRVGTEGYAPYGFGSYMLISQGGTNAGNAVTLTLTGLPAHMSVELDFLLAIINSWDGWEGAPNGHDLFNVEIDGVSVSRNHFSNLWLGNMVNPPPGTAIVFQTNDVAFAGLENGVITHWPDSAYRMTLRTLPHTASTMTIRWYADGGGWQGGPIPTDEFWGIDNLRVRLNNVGQMAPRIVTQPASPIVTSGGIAAFNVSVSAIPAPQFAWYREGSPTVLGVGASLSFGSVGAGDVGGYYVVINNTLGSVTSAVAQLALTDNQPPLKNSPLPDHTITYGAAFNFAVPADTFVEPDAGQTLVWSVNGLPSGLFFNSATRTFSGVPVAGVHLITVTATDNGAPPLSTSDTFRLTVTGSPLYEGFDYPAGTAILTRNGGTGWAGPWYNGTYSNAAPSLSYPGIPATGGRAVALPNSVQARRPIHPSVFAPPAPGVLPTKYFSVLMRADGALNGWCAIDLVGTVGRALSVGKPFGGQTGMYVLETGPQQTASTHAVVTGSNVLLVVKCEFFNGNDRFTLYINPVPGEPPPAPAVVKFDHDVGTTFTNPMISSSIACSIDELRIGDSLAEVVPALCPPVFLVQPSNTTAAIGLPLVLNAPAAGQGPLAYQWRKDSAPLLNNGPITGADTSALVIPSATAADSGAYDVVVTSPCDTLTSQVATISVQGLAFVTQPVSQAVRPGSNATFSVTVSSASPVTYQWQFNGVNIENATSPTLTVLSAQVAQRGNYRCVAHNSLGDFTSANAYLEVIVAPTFVEHPQSLTVAVGADASFSAAVTSTASVPITFTLRKGATSLVNPPPQTLMSTGCTFTLRNVQLTDAGSYRIVATNIAGQLLGSTAATLTVMEPPVITSQPQSLTVAGGASATFTVVATGGAPLTYQWRRNGASLTDATNSTLTITAVAARDAGDYTVVVSNPVGAVPSQAAVLSLEPVVDPLHLAPAVTNAVTGGTVAFIASGGTPPYTFTLAANNSGGSLTPAGSYTAGNTPGIDTVQVTDSAGSNATATIAVIGCTTLNGMVAWWRAENNALDSFDSHDGALMNGAGFAEGQPGQALTFDGVNDFVEIPASPGLSVTGAITVAVWVNRASASASGAVVAKYNSALDRASWGLQLVSGGVEFYVNGSGVLGGAKWADTAPGLLPAGAWSHVAGTFDTENQQLRVFINGQEIPATLGHDAVIPAIVDNEEPVRIGSYVNSSGDLAGFLGALVDEVMLYRRALSPTEVLAVSQGCVVPAPLRVVPDATNTGSGGLVAFNIRGGTPPYTFTLVTNSSGGSITAGGLYTAGAGCGADTVLVTDAAGSNALAGVIVSDAMPPTVTCPADITVEAGSPAGAIVDFTVSASDACTPHPILVVSPPSGSEFPPGTNVVSCQVVDEAGNTGTCTFKIIVRDTTPPTITCPANVAMSAATADGAIVTFAAAATDAADPGVPVICTPASGAAFPVGTTPVQCTATDAAGNTSMCSFTVTVAQMLTGFSISGIITDQAAQPVAGVEVALVGPDGKAFAITDAGGTYGFSSLPSGDYTLKPTHASHTFSPATANIQIDGGSVTRDFSAQRTAIAIRGRVMNCVANKAVAGARVNATGVRQPAYSDSQGNYVLPAVPTGQAITVRAEKPGLVFQPGSTLITDQTRDAMVDFCAAERIRVTDLALDGDSVGIEGATVSLSGSGTSSALTRQGRFSFSALQGASVTLTPNKSRFVFTPPSHSIGSIGQDVSVGFRGGALPSTELHGRLAFSRTGRSDDRIFDSPRAQTLVLNDDGSAGPTPFGPGAGSDPGIDHAWTRDGGRLAFSRGGEILSLKHDGSDLQQLTSDAYYDASPAWSPDGSQFAYISHRNDGRQILIANADGSQPRTLLLGAGQSCSWSPDGSQIAFVAAQHRLHRIRTDGSGLTEVPLPPDYDAVSVAWSPDGSRLACATANGRFSHLLVVGTNGGAPLVTLEHVKDAAWSPDGSRIAFRGSHHPAARIARAGLSHAHDLRPSDLAFAVRSG
jgi:hypothetical protein